METLLLDADSKKTKRYYSVEHYWEFSFFKIKPNDPDRQKRHEKVY
jgi:hypothetical protein